MSTGELTPICTLPYQLEPLNQRHLPEHVVASRILRPLTWLGLIESRRSIADGEFSVHEYRKSPLFDKMLKFDTDVAAGAGPAH
jgi:hypothetical protein